MSESSVERTTRLIATALDDNAFRYQLTVHLNAEDADENMAIVRRAKRLIKDDNPDCLILFFISRNLDKYGEYKPYITFFSKEKFNRDKLKRETERNECMSLSGNRYLSEDRYQGYISRVRSGGVYDLSVTDFPSNFKRFGYLNKPK